jgi:hypothetical protein
MLVFIIAPWSVCVCVWNADQYARAQCKDHAGGSRADHDLPLSKMRQTKSWRVSFLNPELRIGTRIPELS